MSLVSQPNAGSSSRQTIHPDSPVPPNTPIKPITSPSGFIFPAIWSFPPFFTLQPNPSTQLHQITLWTNLILSWARFTRTFEINVEAVDGGGEVFWNKAIGRRLLPASMRVVLAQMVKDGSVVADPPKHQTTFLVYWRKPEEWGILIYEWVTDNGLTGTIMTFFEITDGDLSHTTEFRELPLNILRKSLDTLVKRGKAQIMSGLGESGDGVRFL